MAQGGQGQAQGQGPGGGQGQGPDGRGRGRNEVITDANRSNQGNHMNNVRNELARAVPATPVEFTNRPGRGL